VGFLVLVLVKRPVREMEVEPARMFELVVLERDREAALEVRDRLLRPRAS